MNQPSAEPVFRDVTGGVSPEDLLPPPPPQDTDEPLSSGEIKLPDSLLRRSSKHRWAPREGTVLAQSLADTRAAVQTDFPDSSISTLNAFPADSDHTHELRLFSGKNRQPASTALSRTELETRATLWVVVIGLAAILLVSLLAWFWVPPRPATVDSSLDLQPVKDLEIAPLAAPTPLPIAAVTSVSGLPDGYDNAATASLAADGDPETSWRTAALITPNLLNGRGYGLALNLEEEALPVRQVKLNSPTQGGMLELRATTAEEPTGGQLLGQAALADNVVFDLEQPLPATQLVLWCTQLPKAPGGENRLMISEVQVLG